VVPCVALQRNLWQSSTQPNDSATPRRISAHSTGDAVLRRASTSQSVARPAVEVGLAVQVVTTGGEALACRWEEGEGRWNYGQIGIIPVGLRFIMAFQQSQFLGWQTGETRFWLWQNYKYLQKGDEKEQQQYYKAELIHIDIWGFKSTITLRIIWANSNLKRLLTEFKIGRTPLKIKSFLSIQIHKHISMMMFLTKLTFNWLVNGVRIAKEFWCVITRCSTSRSRELAPQGLPRTLIHQAMRQLTGN
jgi:hypothetical protein